MGEQQVLLYLSTRCSAGGITVRCRTCDQQEVKATMSLRL